jgi:hypothetical protein
MPFGQGGGYGVGDGTQDLQPIINSNGNSFVGVAIQYRVSERSVCILESTDSDACSLELSASWRLTRFIDEVS